MTSKSTSTSTMLTMATTMTTNDDDNDDNDIFCKSSNSTGDRSRYCSPTQQHLRRDFSISIKLRHVCYLRKNFAQVNKTLLLSRHEKPKPGNESPHLQQFFVATAKRINVSSGVQFDFLLPSGGKKDVRQVT